MIPGFPKYILLQDLATLAGISPQAISAHAKKGILVKGDNNQYLAEDSIRALFQYYKKETQAHYREQIDKHKAELAWLDVQERRKTLVPSDVANTLVRKVIGQLAIDLKEIPSRCAATANPSDPIHAKKIIEEQIENILTRAQNAYKKEAIQELEEADNV